MHFKDFVNRYRLNKTLRFRLIPIGATEDNIKRKGLLDADEKLNKEYRDAKRIIDEYHKDFIEKKLSNFSFPNDDIRGFLKLYKDVKNNNRDTTTISKFKKKQDNLRETVSKELEDKNLFKKDFIKETLPVWLEKNYIELSDIENPKKIIENFKDRTTYFQGFWDNRKNIYTKKPHSTSIGYRLIHDNLPRFLDNIDRYEKAKKLGIDFSEVEENFQIKLDDFFKIEQFNKCLTQEGINLYNQIRGGERKENNETKQGINEKINLHAQDIQNREEKRKIQSCQLEELYKQILSDKSKISFYFDDISDDRTLCQQINSICTIDNGGDIIGLYEDVDIKTGKVESKNFNITKKLKEVLVSLEDADPKRIYIRNDRSINDISQCIFTNWNTIKDCLNDYSEKDLFPIPESGRETKKLKKDRELWSKQSYFSFFDIQNAFDAYFRKYGEDELSIEENTGDMTGEGNIKEQKRIALDRPLLRYFNELSINKKNDNGIFEKKDVFEEIKAAYEKIIPVLKKYENVTEKKIKDNKEEVQIIKYYLDSLKSLQIFLRPLHFQLKGREKMEVYEKDSGFYSEFEKLYGVIEQVIPLYDQVRNYLTKKPYSVEKYKLNFENQTLLSGWNKDGEVNNTCVLLLRDGSYFLGIMDKNHKKIFQGELASDGECYKKMFYKQTGDISRNIQNLIRINGNFERKTKELMKLKEKYIPSIAKIVKRESHKTTSDNFCRQDLNYFIDYYKEAASSYWSWCKFSFFPSDEYESFKDFTEHLNARGYSVSFENVSVHYINKCIDQGCLYLFEIYSKDFSPKTRGRPNLHTLYWRELFTEQNLKDVVYKLDGQAELFYRKASISYSDKIRRHGHHCNDLKKKQKYPIIKDRRYARDTYLFHVPITCNFQKREINPSVFNKEVCSYIKENSDIKIIGIDRGERHLAYYTLMDGQGEILEQGSLNNPIGEKDYRDILDKREKERDYARKSWATIGQIKNLKEGYLSQVVHKIATLMVKNNAIIVFEDLNFGFKKGRFKIEKQVYQKLEKMLIDKLNYLVFKDSKPDTTGGVLKALQLTARFESFKKLGKQTGFIFYVPAHYTSKICPATGFVNLLYPRYETIEKAKCFFKKFIKICFNNDEKYFEFHFNYRDFPSKVDGIRSDWIICSYGTRLESYRDPSGNNIWKVKEVNLTEEIKTLLSGCSVDFHKEGCLKDQISQKGTSDFFKSFIRLLKLTLQMRNSNSKTGEDWLVSPVKNYTGKFFDSREVVGDSMPYNADANGAYHIGLKGLLMMNQIRAADNASNQYDLKNKVWFEFVQQRRSRNHT